MVLALVVLPGVPNGGHGQLRVLHAVRLGGALAQSSPVVADDGGVAKVGINSVVARGVCDCDVDVVHPRHALGDHDLLLLGGVHVSLAPHDELGAFHGAVSPNLGVVAVVADDERHLDSFGAGGDVRAVSRVPSLDGAPGEDLAVLLDNLALVVDEHQRVVRLLLRVLVALAREGEDSPDFGLFARGTEHVRLGPRDVDGGGEHLIAIVHDALRAVLGEDDEVHSGKALLHALDLGTNRLDIGMDVIDCVQTRHLVLTSAQPFNHRELT
mmetsp:Transcript_4779/g.21633  ORF Transcript_4779/g.21633 Transcript_4779/m.21633 type:complete len:269 (+) Transcript_4779:1630-2436(+)